MKGRLLWSSPTWTKVEFRLCCGLRKDRDQGLFNVKSAMIILTPYATFQRHVNLRLILPSSVLFQ